MPFHSDADYLRLHKGNYRVRVKVPLECRGRLPEPHTNKVELIKSTGTSNRAHAVVIARKIISDYQAMIEAARPVKVAWPKVIWHHNEPIETEPEPWPPLVWRPRQTDAPPVVEAAEPVTFTLILDYWGKVSNHRQSVTTPVISSRGTRRAIIGKSCSGT